MPFNYTIELVGNIYNNYSLQLFTFVTTSA